jgi:hypothetical protein
VVTLVKLTVAAIYFLWAGVVTWVWNTLIAPPLGLLTFEYSAVLTGMLVWSLVSLAIRQEIAERKALRDR